MNPPARLRELLAAPGFVVMPAVWDGLSAKMSAAAGFKTAFLSGSCVAATRWHAAPWPGATCTSAGSLARHFGMTWSQRFAKRQPSQGETRLGTAPGIASRVVRPGVGRARSSLCV